MSAYLRPGQLLKNGEIEVIDRVGAGGVGEVYRAAMVCDGVRKIVALKCFNPEKIQPSAIEAIEMVHRESVAISRIQHPNIVRILEVNIDGALPFIVEEFLAGGDLAQLIHERLKIRQSGEPVLSPFEIASLGQQVCAGLMMLHQNNQYHGDLKPNNLCFRSANHSEIVIVDFGHAGFIEDNLLERNETLAALAYIPPERTGFVRMAGNSNSDLYSLGVTLYEAALGQPPFMGSEGRDIINRLLYEVPKPLCEIFSNFPPALSDIISKLLRKNPQDRYHSAFGLAADFERCLKALAEGVPLAGFALGTKDKLRELNYRIPMVGRDREISRLQAMFDQACHQGAEVVLIGAPSGTGKSRLAFEVLHRAREASAYISCAKFSEYERNLPLSAISLLLVEHSHYLRTRSSHDLRQWQKRVKEKLGSHGRMMAERFPCYEGLLPDFPPPAHHESDSNFQIFNQCLGDFLTILAASGETQLLLLDDLQWADWQSYQVLGALTENLWSKRAQNIMFMGTYRSNEVNAEHALTRTILHQCPAQSFIELGPLQQADSDRLIRILLEESGAEIEKLQDVTYRFTAGNPFYIYEYLKSAIHTGIYAFDEDSKAWYFHEERIHQASLSAGVAALVGDRIRLLNPINQALIGLASLAGQAMSRRALVDIVPVLLAERGLSDSWSAIQDKAQYLELAYQEFLQKNLLVPDTHSFRFFHDKIQEASCATLSETEKRILHSAYGLWCAKNLEQSESVNEAQIFEAAYHLCQGDQTILDPFSCRVLIHAAKLAQAVYAYDKAKDYLSAVIVAHDSQNVFSHQEKFEAMELLANTLTISDQVKEALELYDKLLESECTPLQRASIFCKKSEFGLSLLDFKQARDASIAGLEALKAPYLIRVSSSYLYMLFFLPALAVYAIYFHLFGRQTKEMNDETEALKFQLQLKNQLSQHMLRPIVAIANLVLVTFELLPYKECYARSTVFCYWGVVLGPFGLEKLSGRFLATAYEYFDRTSDPVSKGQLLYFWGYLCDFPAGNVTAAQKKLEEAVAILEPIGESFWRSMSIVGLLSLDYFGSESGQAGIRSHELIEQWKKLRFEPTGLAFTLRHFLENEREDQVDYFLNLAREAALKSHLAGFDSVEALMAWQCMGEYHELKGNYELATKYFRHATWFGASRLHRSGTITYAPIALARVLIHQRRRLEALPPLVLSWFNQLMNARVLLPQTLIVTGYWLDSMGWKRVGQRVMESGIKYASQRRWATVAAEGRLLLGRLMENIWPEMALVNLQLAKECFQQKSWKFHIHACDQEMVRQKLAHSETDAAGISSTRSTTQTTRRGGSIRQKIEIKSLFEVLLKLSAISQKEALFRSLMESLCYATGSELAVLFLSEEERWVPQVAYNLEIQSGDRFNSRVDIRFVDHCTSTQIRDPLVRGTSDNAVGQNLTGGSAMMVPLIYEARIYGYCYLANTQIYDLFDEQSIEISAPIAIQATIALQNIILNSQLAIERDQLAELHRTLEHRVMEQTRDIKSIMQHINMGICTVSGPQVLIDKDYSLFLETLLHESPLNGKAILPILLARSQLGADEKDQVLQAIRASMSELELAFRVNDHLLPRTLRGSSDEGSPFVLELDWIPIINESSSVEKILITINDVTALRALEQQAHEKDQEMKIIFEILSCGNREWDLFISNSEKLLLENARLADALVSGTAGESALRKIFVNMHTIKGNARALGCKVLNETIHGIEQYFSQAIRAPDAPVQPEVVEQKLAEVESIFRKYRDIAENKLGRTNPSGQTETISSERLLDVEATFQQLCMGLETLAIDLGKAKPRVNIRTPHICATDQGNEVLRNSFMHLIRNCLDHGIETPEERLRLGKTAEGIIEISSQVQGRFVVFRLTDDGRGLNLRKIASIGLERGLLNEFQVKDDRVVAALIFTADFSTAETLTDVSGRGIGMTAVAQYIETVGGEIDIEFLENRMNVNGFRPFAFIISLPVSLFQVGSVELQSA